MPFAYDFLGLLRPSIIVELGTHFGDSFFTFCQSCKEHNLQAKCYAVDSWIGDDVTLYSLAEITIGSDVVISQRSYICAATHDYSRPTFDMIGSPIVIEDQAWLATDVFVAPGVKVCRGAVVGARSSVYKDVASGSISVGNPARVTGAR